MLRSIPRLNFPSAWRLAFWNALLILVFLLLIIIIGEAYLRLTIPFMRSSQVTEFVPRVGLLYKPKSVVYATNGLEFWIKSKVNSIGFLERESRTTERPEKSCHIAFIGDSFVENREVKLADRFSVITEDIAKVDLPDLDITTSAFGRRATGQIHQISYYDRFARKMNPDLLILVFVANDFLDNSSFLYYIQNSLSPWDPDHPPHSYALKSKQGEIFLYPPDQEFQKYSIISPSNNPMIAQIEIFPNAFFRSWLSLRLRRVPFRLTPHISRNERLRERVNALRDRPRYTALMVDWKPLTWGKILRSFEQNRPIKALQNSLDFTAFSLDQFKERADRDGVSLAILATDSMSTLRVDMSKGIEGRSPIDYLREMAVTRGIPVIDMYDYLVRQDRRVEDSIAAMHFERDPHWNEVGHRIAAEAVLEYLKENTGVCETRDAVETVP